ncbi:hypothetical protein [Pseudoxanthomonas indica]|uniref:Secreted protein n=1 Tax=Pseudoxanthomonas indica TaxID=428993 RepID=A0A1T5LNN4_9GAMM|nr:hypothetical protein [Pseudoxanthomonas indica]GGD37451.1 hypothetical protein GCM10007235_07030 [Pseudoxanthomonas indica]SKC77593.1 hypothetical protein SAMN06296058_2825 [Pseudoxanthomonas indica]
MKTIWLWALLGLAPVAMAAQPYVKLEQRLSAAQMQETGLSQLSAGQLARLNALLAEDAAQAQAREEQAASNAAATTAGASLAAGGHAASAGSSDDHDTRGRDSLIGFNDEPIRSKLVGTVQDWEPGTVFVLENGQQWKVLKGKMHLSKPLQNPDIRVIPGVAGRWFLEVQEDTPKARVYRID